jgi:putative colanic acid biosynthesis acetyltransferase WcaF
VNDDTKPSAPPPPPARKSAWSKSQRLVRAVWGIAGRPVWACVPGARPSLIRLFGGSVGSGCRFAGSVKIAVPWNLRIGSRVAVGEDAVLYSLGTITIGDDVVIDARAHVCAGTHDMTDSTFPLLRPPIEIGDGCFVGFDAFIGPDVTLGEGCRVWPRAAVYRSQPAGASLRGNPAAPIEPETEA